LYAAIYFYSALVDPAGDLLASRHSPDCVVSNHLVAAFAFPSGWRHGKIHLEVDRRIAYASNANRQTVIRRLHTS